jgi:putative NIF3 family GTP cyclohydrolase 1 type 2
MEWKQAFDIAIGMGHKSDIRNIDNPGAYSEGYPDCRIIYGDPGEKINDVYIAVDAGVPELLVVNEFKKRGKNINGVIMHHPTGIGAYTITGVVELQKYNWVRNGANPKRANKIYEEMVRDEEIGIKAGNHTSVENAAKLLDIPVICIHTAIDNVVQAFFEELALQSSFSTVDEILGNIKILPECAMASANGDGPYLIGERKAEPGKIMVDMTGGMDPDPSIFPMLKKAGIKTLIAMHYSQENVKAMIKNGINAVITGHMASDSIGLNMFCDRLEKMGIGIICGPGLYRHNRKTGSGTS